MLKSLVDKAVDCSELKKEEIIALLKCEDEVYSYLCSRADGVREKYTGNTVHLRGIIEFSNYCYRSCKYCGLRKENGKLARFRIKPAAIIKIGLRANEIGYKTVVLQSGEDNYPADKIEYVIGELKTGGDLAVTLSLGERKDEEYRQWREAGADRYLLKHETAEKKLYHRVHPGMDYNKRIKILKHLGELGYQVGSGNIIGLPGQDEETLADDILLFKELDLDMVGIGPFIPHPETPLQGQTAGSVTMTLKVLALTRLLLPRAHLPATTALSTIDPEGRKKALSAGANVIMPNVTPAKYRRLYEIYPGQNNSRDRLREDYREVNDLIESLGRNVGSGYGHSKK